MAFVTALLFGRDRCIVFARDELGRERVAIPCDIGNRCRRPTTLPSERLVVVRELLALPLPGRLLLERVGDPERARARGDVEDEKVTRAGSPIESRG